MTLEGPPPRHLHPVEPPFDPDYDNGRRPPHDPAAEQAVLGALLNAPELAEAIETHLDPDDFYRPAHATIWTAIHHLRRTDGVPPDPVTLAAHLTRTGDLARIGGGPFLHDLMAACPLPSRAPEYATIVRDHARLRAVQTTATRLHNLANSGRIDNIDHALGEALQALDETALRFGPRTTTAITGGLADLTWVLDMVNGGQAPTNPPPAWGRRTDGTALFYAGRVNGIFGDPESGKTWLAQCAGVEALNAGGTFSMIDVDHNGQNHTAARLLLLGARPEHIADPDRFRYYEPEDAPELHAAVTDITTRAPNVVVLDSLGELLPMLDVKSIDNDEITAALRSVCMPPAKAGSCVIHVDHLPKSVEARSTGYAIGGTAKKRAVDGAYLRAEARTQPTPGGIGRITLRIEKDRTGELRRSSGGGYAGTFTIDSTAPSVTTWSIAREDAPKNDDGTFRPTALMERVSRYIEDNDQCTFTDLKEAITGKDKWLRDAIQLLVTEGFVSRFDGARRAKLHHSIAPYREAEDDHVQHPN